MDDHKNLGHMVFKCKYVVARKINFALGNNEMSYLRIPQSARERAIETRNIRDGNTPATFRWRKAAGKRPCPPPPWAAHNQKPPALPGDRLLPHSYSLIVATAFSSSS